MSDERQITSRSDEDALKRMSSLYQTRYITVDDLKESGPVTMKILHIYTEQLESIMLGNKKIEGSEKGVLEFDRPEGKKRLIILNRTSLKELKTGWGMDQQNWVGGSVKLEHVKRNGKNMVLVSPVMAATVPGKSGSKPATSAPAGNKPAPPGPAGDDDLSFSDEKIPEDRP